MSAPNLVLKSVTGVDVQLQIAGPGSRSFAFVIDWHIRLIFAFIWFVSAVTALGLWNTNLFNSTSFAWIVFLPSLVIYFFYHPVLEIIMRGRSPGKRLAGVRVVTVQGEIPSFGAIVLRNLFRLVDALPTFYIVGLLCVMITGRHVRIGDLAAGTLLVIDATEAEHSLDVLSRGATTGSSTLSPQAFELVHEVLERWSSLELPARNEVARALLIKIDPSVASAVSTSSTSDLHERLRALLTHGAPA